METSAEEEQVQLSSDPKYLGLGSTVFGGKVQTGSQQSVISSNHLLAAFINPFYMDKIYANFINCIRNNPACWLVAKNLIFDRDVPRLDPHCSWNIFNFII